VRQRLAELVGESADPINPRHFAIPQPRSGFIDYPDYSGTFTRVSVARERLLDFCSVASASVSAHERAWISALRRERSRAIRRFGFTADRARRRDDRLSRIISIAAREDRQVAAFDGGAFPA